MEDKSKIKTIFSIDIVSIISDTDDDKVGEAQTGYEYTFDGSLPELAYALFGFLTQVENDPDLKQITKDGKQAGAAFIELLQMYYKRGE